jgi:hypothetical protein
MMLAGLAIYGLSQAMSSSSPSPVQTINRA